uniref:Uncharacterized protein n=2 Tax=Anguilla anguilla TaxID=7936 RepID=A0A0E9VJS0_ANGAN
MHSELNPTVGPFNPSTNVLTAIKVMFKKISGSEPFHAPRSI